MITVALTGGIGSGKSAVAAFLSSAGIPVFDCDAAAKSVYTDNPDVVDRIGERLGRPLRLADGTLDKSALAEAVFSSEAALEIVENEVLPLVKTRLLQWKSSLSAPLCVVESATILSKPIFDGTYDSAVLVDAPVRIRLRRILSRGGITREDALLRISSQSFDPSKVSGTILNDNNLRTLHSRTAALFSTLYPEEFRFYRKNS